MEYDIRIYSTTNGREPFREWLDSLKDLDTQALIIQRLQRIKLGNFGDCKPIAEGLWEFRIHHKAGNKDLLCSCRTTLNLDYRGRR